MLIYRVTVVVVLASCLVGCRSAPPPMTPTQRRVGQEKLEPLRDALAQEPENAQSKFELARELYFQSTVGDRDALGRASAMFTELHEAEPDNPKVMAYMGSVVLVDARDSVPLPTLLPQVHRGLELLDRAKAAAPDDLEVRVVRGLTLINVPGMFNRRQEAEADLSWSVARIDRGVETGRLDHRAAASVLFNQGKVLEQQGQSEAARAMWQRAVAMAPGSVSGQSAARRLGKSQSNQ